MIWYFVALLGALGNAIYFSLSKKAVKTLNLYWFSAVVSLLSGTTLLFIAFVEGIPKLGPNLWISVCGSVFVNVFATILYLKALKISDISLTMPMLSFTPLFLIGTSYIMVNEFPSIIGISGILLIGCGAYVLNIEAGSGFFAPFMNLVKERGSVYMLIVAFLFSIGSNFDKISLLNSSPIFASSLLFLSIGAVFLIISLFKADNKIASLKKNSFDFILPAIAMAFTSILMMTAMKYILVSYAISIKRISILFTTLAGFMFFREKNIASRLAGSLIIVLGTVLIAFA